MIPTPPATTIEPVAVLVDSDVLFAVIVPEAVTLVPLKLEEVIVLLLSVSEPVSVARVPVVGRVTVVFAVAVRVVLNAPEVVRLPPRVIVLVPLLTPVPP